MRVLITGAGGLLGGRLCSLLAPRHAITAVVRQKTAPPGIRAMSVDLAEEDAVAAMVKTAGAQAVIHCAALADPEVCEREPERATRENEIATRNLAISCRGEGIRLITISTDLVFGGSRAFWTEDMALGPLSVYGRSKASAEAAALRVCPDAAILRVALICGLGYGGRLSASEGVAQRLRLGKAVSLYQDEWRTPIDPESVAMAIEAVLARRTARGIFHIGGAVRLNRAELGEQVAAAFGLDASLVRRTSRTSHRGAPRAEDVSLDITRAREELDWTPRPLPIALREGRTA